MADLTGWTGPVGLGPFRIGLRRPREIDLSALTDSELLERVREFLPRLVVTWRAGNDPGDEYLMVRALQHCPDLSDLLSDREAHELGIGSHDRTL